MNFAVISPASTKELLSAIRDHQESNFRFCAGGTDLLLELKHQPNGNLTIINLARLTDDHFGYVAGSGDRIRIGARGDGK